MAGGAAGTDGLSRGNKSKESKNNKNHPTGKEKPVFGHVFNIQYSGVFVSRRLSADGLDSQMALKQVESLVFEKVAVQTYIMKKTAHYTC